MRYAWLAFPATLVAAIAIAAVAIGAKRPSTSPAATVKELIATGVVGTDDGYEACSYLTLDEQHAVSLAGGGEGCRMALAHAQLQLGPKRVVTVDDLRLLTIRTERVSGDRAWVRVSGSGGSAQFVLARANPAERSEYEPPKTDWRVADGAQALRPSMPLVTPIPVPQAAGPQT
jgi:hypothetical protein